MLTLLTPTGARPQALKMLASHVAKQTYRGPTLWIIVDDCDPISTAPCGRPDTAIMYVRPPWRWKPGENTQAKSLLFGLSRVPETARVAILEDDDYYGPEYLENISRGLDDAELVGQSGIRYYNLATQRYDSRNYPAHAALAATAVRGAALSQLKKICQQGPHLIDTVLWKTFRGKKALLASSDVVGLKGLPGRPGIGIQHRPAFGRPDPGEVLGDWLGSSLASRYRELVGFDLRPSSG